MCDLKAKIKEWEEWLNGNDINSIQNQIYNMIWDSAVFLSINECRKYAPKNDKGKPELNGMIHQFINRCFYETQAIAIRRLLDKRSDVISLLRLVDDMKKHCHLLTRGNILAVHSYPYEYEREQKRLRDEALGNVPPGTVVMMGDDYRKCMLSKYVHGMFDHLAKVQPSQRSPQDCVTPQIFEWMKERLNRCEGIVEFVNKFFAHPATPESRDYRNPPELDVTLGRILEAQKILCQTAIFIGTQMGILSEGKGVGDVLPVPQFDQFIYFDKAWASQDTIKKLHEFWNCYDMETRNWHNWDWQGDFNKYMQQSNLL